MYDTRSAQYDPERALCLIRGAGAPPALPMRSTSNAGQGIHSPADVTTQAPDLGVVRTLARALAPDDIAREGVERAAFVRACAGGPCGDFCDAFALDHGSVALVVGDVSGQGLEAAAHVPDIRAMARLMLYADPDPGRALAGINNALFLSAQTASEPAWFVSMSIAVVYPNVGVGAFACAGADPPMIVSTRAVHSSVSVGGLPLGVCEDAQYCVVQRPLGPSDLVVMATGGVFEAGRPHRPLGPERFIKWMNGLVQIGSLRVIGQMLMDEVETYSRGTRAGDTALLLARLI